MSSPLNIMLETANLSIGYTSKRSDETSISEALNLRLQRGKFVCLLGPNGAGKSTLIRTLSGLQPSLAGEVFLNGTELDDLDARTRAKLVSLVITDTMPVGIFTVYSLVALGRHPHTRWNGNLTEKDHQKIDWALRTVNAQSLVDRQITELSDGERQKVMVARALAQEAPLMLLDEPTAYLDILRRVELMRTLGDLIHNQQLAILLSTHDLELALRSADELWLLSEAGELTIGAPESLALTGKIAEVFGDKQLDWDNEQGSFRVHREPCLRVELSGKGAKRIWTQRALARLGYGIASNGQDTAFSISISDNEDSTLWLVRQKETTFEFATLELFIQWVESSHTGHK